MIARYVRENFLEQHRDLPRNQIVALIGSHRRVVWPQICPSCGTPASTHLAVAKTFGRRVRHGGSGYRRLIVRMRMPFCRACAERHEQTVQRMPSVIGSFFRTPALLSFIGASAVGWILWMIFVQGGEGISTSMRLYAIAGILTLVGIGAFMTISEARFLRVPPLTDVTSACDFSDNFGVPYGYRRLYAMRNAAFAEAFARANQDRLWTEAIQKRDSWLALAGLVVLIVAAVVVWMVKRG